MCSTTTSKSKAEGGMIRPIRNLFANRSGVGAIEFALVAPVLILLYIGSAEISVAMSINKKVARATSTIADLVSQKTCVTDQDLSVMPNVAEAVMVPYDESVPQIKITEIDLDSSGQAKVLWSWDGSGTPPYTQGSSVTLPSDLVVDSSHLVRAEVSFVHHVMLPVYNALGASTINMDQTYYLNPRVNGAVQKLSSCP